MCRNFVTVTTRFRRVFRAVPRQHSIFDLRVERGVRYRKGVACVPRDAVVVAEGGQWIADGMVNPGAAHVDRRTGEIDGVQPATDAVAAFEHYGVNASLTQPRCGGQPRDSGADDHHALDWPGDLVHRAIVALSRGRRQ